MRLTELKTDAEFAAIWPLIHQLNPDLPKPLFTARLKKMRAQGYRCVAAIEGKRYIGLSGFWVGTRFWCGTYVDIDNVIVDESARSRGIGAKLTRWIENEAKRLGADVAVLDSYATNHHSHRFYMREGYVILGYHFVKKMKDDATVTNFAKPRRNAKRSSTCTVA